MAEKSEDGEIPRILGLKWQKYASLSASAHESA